MLQSPPIARVLSTLWTMLNRKQRGVFLLLIGALMVSGVMEMGGMLIIFGFIQGLQVNEETGQRAGRLIKILENLGEIRLTNMEYVIYFGAGLVAVLAVRNSVGTIANFLLSRFLMKLNQRVSVNLFRGYLMAPYERLNVDGATKASSAISRIFQEFSSSFSATAQVLSDGLTVSMVTVLLLFVDPWLTLVAGVLFAGGGVVSYARMQATLRSLSKQERLAQSKADAFLRDGLEGLIDTRLRDARRYVVGGYSEALNRLALYKRRGTTMNRMPRTVNEMALALFLVGVVARITIAEQDVADALPTLGVFGFAGWKMNGFMARINKGLQVLRFRDEGFAEHAGLLRTLAPAMIRGADDQAVEQYVQEERELPENTDGKLHEAIAVNNVTYRYPETDEDALSGVNMTIKKGDFVGICGSSGGGKSTLALMLLGLLQATKGEIRCDDWPLFHHIRLWHKNVGYVGQDMYISRASIRENVAFAVPPDQIDDDRVNDALRMASAEPFVKRFKKGARTKLKPNGRNLSMGQRQRLMIARALYLNPDVLIFDEATASLDNITEREISDSIAELSGEKTIVCIAHRLSTLRNCDKIYVVNHGKVVDSGSYDDLLQTSAAFQELAHAATRQSGEPADGRESRPA